MQCKFYTIASSTVYDCTLLKPSHMPAAFLIQHTHVSVIVCLCIWRFGYLKLSKFYMHIQDIHFVSWVLQDQHNMIGFLLPLMEMLKIDKFRGLGNPGNSFKLYRHLIHASQLNFTLVGHIDKEQLNQEVIQNKRIIAFNKTFH